MLKQHATSEEWALTASDHVLIATRSRARRLGFATLLLFFRANRRFPRAPAEIDTASVIGLAEALGVDIETSSAILMPDRTMERHRSEIRALFGFREATVADAEALTAWARDHAVHQTRDVDHLIKVLETRCGTLSIEPPAPDRMERIVRAAVRAYEEHLHGAAYDRLTPDVRKRLDALLRASGTDEPRADGPELTPEEQATIGLNALRGDPGRASVNSLRDELGKLAVVREIALPADLFADWSPQELEACRRRVAVESPFELRRHPEVTRLVWLAAFVHLRGRGITDSLVDLLIETVHYIGAHAERRVEEELLDDLKRVGGKQNLLFALAGAAIDNPEDTVRNVIFPVVGEQTLHDLVREYKASGPNLSDCSAYHDPQLLPRALSPGDPATD